MDIESEAVNTITKQNYLKEHIVNKNYDPSQFAKFLESKKVNGDRIENWTLRELIELVETYKRVPHVIFPKVHNYSMTSLFSSIVLNVETADEYVMYVDDAAAPVRRKVNDINWALKVFGREYPAMHIPSTWNYEAKGHLVLVEYLFGLFGVVESPALYAFFRYPESDFVTFKNVS